MIPIIKKEFSAKWISLTVYCLVIIGLSWLYVGLFPSIQAQAASLTKIIDQLGAGIKALGVTQIGFDTLDKYLSIEVYGITWPLLVITFVTSRAGHALAGETETGTMGTILSLPVSRANIYLAKYFAGLVGLVVFVAVSIFSAPIFATIYNVEFAWSNFVSLSVLCLLFSWALYSLGMMLSAIFNEKGRVNLAIGGILLLMYVANVIAGLSDKFDWLRFGSLFHYFNASAVLISNDVSLTSYGVFTCIILVSTVAGMIWFARKDVIV